MANFLFLYPNIFSYGLTPIGISITSALLKKYGHQTDLFDTAFMDMHNILYDTEKNDYPKKFEQLMFFKPVDLTKYGIRKEKINVINELKKKIDAFKPDVIAYSFWSCQLTGEDEGMMYDRGKILLEKAGVSHNKTGINIISGGIYPSLEPEKVLNNGINNMVCIGESEYAFLELANKIDKNADLTGIENIWCKKDNRLFKNRLRPLIENLDELPAGDFDIFDDRSFYRPYHGKVVRGIDYELTRGCVNRCYYCAGPKLRDLYGDKNFRREKSIKKIVEEISFLKKKYKLDIIRYQDELFLGMDLSKLKQLAKEYREKVDLPFIIETSVNTINADTAYCLKEMGCLSVSIGIEQGNEIFRKKVLNKHYTNEQAIEAFKILKKYNIAVHAYSMMGFPSEKRDLIFDTINLLKKLNISTYQVSYFQPFVGTILREFCIKNNLIKEDEKLKEFVQGSIVRNDFISKEELSGLQRTFTMYVFMPKFFWGLVKMAEKNNFVYNLIQSVVQMILK